MWCYYIPCTIQATTIHHIISADMCENRTTSQMFQHKTWTNTRASFQLLQRLMISSSIWLSQNLCAFTQRYTIAYNKVLIEKVSVRTYDAYAWLSRSPPINRRARWQKAPELRTFGQIGAHLFVSGERQHDFFEPVLKHKEAGVVRDARHVRANQGVGE